MIEIDTKDFERGINSLIKNLSDDKVIKDVALVADELLIKSKAVVPFEKGLLFKASAVNIYRKKQEVVFGYDRVYAAFQDAFYKTEPHVILPRAKRALFIALTPAARSHRRGNNPINEGLIEGVDYVIRSNAVIPIKSYGSKKGPNQYFSGTIKRNVGWALGMLSTLIGNRIKKSRKK